MKKSLFFLLLYLLPLDVVSESESVLLKDVLGQCQKVNVSELAKAFLVLDPSQDGSQLISAGTETISTPRTSEQRRRDSINNRPPRMSEASVGDLLYFHPSQLKERRCRL